MNSHQQALTPPTGVGVASLPTGIAGQVHMVPSPGPGASSTNHVNPTSNNANHGNSVNIVNGKQGSSGSASSTGALSGNTMAGRKRGNSGDKKNGPPPTCLGCGATETPEWRRGPMGPRTLCNACVSPNSSYQPLLWLLSRFSRGHQLHHELVYDHFSSGERSAKGSQATWIDADIHLSIGACAHEVTEEEEEGRRESETGSREGEGSGVGIRRGGGALWRWLSKRFTKCLPSLMRIGKNRLKRAHQHHEKRKRQRKVYRCDHMFKKWTWRMERRFLLYSIKAVNMFIA